ncbi:hypothetical protein [Sediminicoccus sp. BL-A-41-H5]|uniref:hypothetical protein n=1 Tax=Sediminicoccus sp. BL-A-41-H5 TaxID=3421106 RepID=UPI003D664F51
MTRLTLYLCGAVLTLGFGANASAQTTVQSGTQSGSEAGASAAAIAAPTYYFSGNPERQDTVSRVTTVAPVTAPNIFSSNPCVVSVSGAMSVMGFGMALGAGVEDRDCTRRANAALLAQMGLARAAAEVLCHNSEIRASMAVAGVPCAADRPANTIMPNPPAPPASNVSAAPGATFVRARPDWCDTASAAERRARPGVC